MTMAEIVPFPLTHRVRSIRRMARMMASYSPEGGERALTTPLRQQYAALLRRGVAPEVAAREVRSFELAIRAQLWRLVLVREGGDGA
jgi:hypothetical protein